MFRKSARPFIFAIILVLLLSSCSAKTENTATQSTVIPDINPAALATKLVDLMDLEALSFIPGDLPEGYTTARVVRTLPEGYYEMGVYTDMIYLTLEKFNHEQGGVFIFLYDDDVIRENAYQTIAQQLGKRGDIVNVEMQALTGIGEKATLMAVGGKALNIKLNLVEMVFEHCGAVVNISIGDNGELKDVEGMVTAYASQLANRLELIACK
jgi:hypothetical protein